MRQMSLGSIYSVLLIGGADGCSSDCFVVL